LLRSRFQGQKKPTLFQTSNLTKSYISFSSENSKQSKIFPCFFQSSLFISFLSVKKIVRKNFNVISSEKFRVFLLLKREEIFYLDNSIVYHWRHTPQQ
jgi:hypothetical protein